MKKLDLYTTQTLVAKNITSFKGRQATVTKNIDKLALSCVYVRLEFGDATLADRLILNVPKQMQTSLRAYFLETGFFVYKDNTLHSKKGFTQSKEFAVSEVSKLVNFSEWNKKPADKKPAKQRLDQRIKSTYTRLNTAVTAVDKTKLSAEDLISHNDDLKVLNSFESYVDNIANGVSLQDAVSSIKLTQAELISQAKAALVDELLKGQSKFARDTLALLVKPAPSVTTSKKSKVHTVPASQLSA